MVGTDQLCCWTSWTFQTFHRAWDVKSSRILRELDEELQEGWSCPQSWRHWSLKLWVAGDTKALRISQSWRCYSLKYIERAENDNASENSLRMKMTKSEWRNQNKKLQETWACPAVQKVQDLQEGWIGPSLRISRVLEKLLKSPSSKNFRRTEDVIALRTSR